MDEISLDSLKFGWRNGVAILFHRFRDNAVIPQKSTEFATGFDLVACEGGTIPPYGTASIPLGFNMSFCPRTWDVQIRSRSGLSFKGLAVANSPATIDADYSGMGESFELKVILQNHTNHPWEIYPGDRIAQMVFQELRNQPVLMEVSAEQFEQFVNTADRTGGLGSTGV